MLAIPFAVLCLIQAVGLLLMKGYRHLRNEAQVLGEGWRGLLTGRDRARRRRSTVAGPVAALPEYETPRRTPPLWGWLVACGTLASAVWVFRAFPNTAELRHWLDRASGYRATRIELVLARDDEATRTALVQALTPLMQTGARAIRYRSSYLRVGYAERTEVPSYYRFVDGRMQIAMGGVLPADRLAVLSAGLDAIAAAGNRPALPERLPVTISRGTRRASLELLPRGAALVFEPDDAQGTPFTEPGRSRCHLDIQAALTPEAFALADARTGTTHAADAQIRLPAGTALHEDRYIVTGISAFPAPASSTSAGPSAGGEGYRRHLHVLPASLQRDWIDCALALPAAVDPVLLAAAMEPSLPGLGGRLRSARIATATTFRPWTEAGWTAVPPKGEASASAQACRYEEWRRLRTLNAWIMSECRTEGRSPECSRLSAQKAYAEQQAAACLSGAG